LTCTACGAPLTRVCAACGERLPAGYRYCGACGAEQPQPTRPRHGNGATGLPEAPADGGAERRQLTVLFADLVDSTALAERLDPEDLRDLMRQYVALCGRIVGARGGEIAEVAGDGVVVFFGHPKAFEDAAERAVLAGLELAEAVRRRPFATPIAVRIGIATGLMIVGDTIETGGIRQREIVGSPASLAARLQKLAAPDTVVVGAATRRLIGDSFVVTDLGKHPLAGFDGPVEAFRVTGENDRTSRLLARAGRSMTPMVDREAERALLREHWRKVAAGGKGGGRVVLIGGEPGIGKSRLVLDLAEHLAGEPHALLCYDGSPLYRHTPFHPVARRLRDAAGITATDSPARRHAKLRRLLPGPPNRPSPEGLELLVDLCGSPGARDERPAERQPGDRRETLLPVVLELLGAHADGRPLLLVVEDVQWLDATTADLLDRLVHAAPQLGLLLIATFRTGFTTRWGHLPHVTSLTLEPLEPDACRGILAAVLGSRVLPPAVAEAIIGRTDGVPLFVEELTKAVLEAHDRPPEAPAAAASSVPQTLRDALMARLDRHADSRTVAQIAAAIGREFTHELLALIAPLRPAALAAALDDLCASGLVFRRGAPPRTTYAFKHALVQECAYGSLLKRRRRALHGEIAAVLDRHFPDTPPDLLGHHFAEAGETEAALARFERAAELARGRSANAEAAAHFARALALLEALPQGPARERRELELRVGHGAQLIAVEGNAAAAVGEAYERALALGQRVGTADQVFRVLRGLQTFHIVRGELKEARAIGERLLDEARRGGDDDRLLQAHRPHGLCLLYMGELGAARRHLERAAALYDPARHGRHRFLYGSDPGALAHCNLAWVELLAGNATRAQDHLDTALALAARPEPHPHSQAFVLSLAASAAQFAGDAERATALAGTVIALAQRHHFAYWGAWGRVVRGWARAVLGEPEAGLEDCRAGIAAYRTTGAGLMVPCFLGLEATTALAAGAPAAALAAVELALDLAAKGEIRFYEPELWRLRASLGGGPVAERRRWLERAATQARAQGARLFAERAEAAQGALGRAAHACEPALAGGA
jgi:class 3 adenylate cyclase/predicted ATPase